MLTRDGFTFGEAVQVLTTPSGAPYSLAELEAIYLRLPHPTIRMTDAVAANLDLPVYPEDRIEMHDLTRTARKAASAIDGMIESMATEDRLILKLRFWQSLKVPDIARRLNLDQKKVYKRIDRLVTGMRRNLEQTGVTSSDVNDLFRRSENW